MFPFRLNLPSDLPGSIYFSNENYYATVEYSVKIQLESESAETNGGLFCKKRVHLRQMDAVIDDSSMRIHDDTLPQM